MAWTEFDRRHLAELCREQDRLMAEHREDERRRAAEWEAAEEERRAVITEIESSRQRAQQAGAEGHVRDGNAPAGAVEADEEEDDNPPGFFDDPELNRAFRDCMAETIVELRREWRDAIKVERENHERALTERDSKIARLEGQIDTLLSFIGQRSAAKFSQSSESSELDLPNWRGNN
jgi:hypothetical protein